MLDRRSFLKLTSLSGVARYVPAGFVSPHWKNPKFIPKSFWSSPSSPAMTPFIAPLPLPPVAQRTRRFPFQCSTESQIPRQGRRSAPYQSRPAGTFGDVGPQALPAGRPHFYRMVMEEATLSMHPDIPDTTVWRYRDSTVPSGSYTWALGPTFQSRMNHAAIIRLQNNLPLAHMGFGDTTTSMHLHGGHVESRSDGFPDAISGFDPVLDVGDTYDYCYAMRDPGFAQGAPDKEERPSTLWYHDHRLDFTGANVMRGLAGMHTVFDGLDTGNENSGLQLPSGEFDVPLVFQDRLFAVDGSLCYTPGTFNGFLGDRYCVNGAVQPFFNVKRRKYRFRLLNGSNARFYKFVLSDSSNNTYSFDQIGSDGALLASTISGIGSVLMGMAERKEIVIDFSQFTEGTELYLEDLINQATPSGPGGTPASPTCVSVGSGTRAIKFVVGASCPDPSNVPTILRPLTAVGSTMGLPTRSFNFNRIGGSWTINSTVVDVDVPIATVPKNTPEVWTFSNGSGGTWWHPVHVHHEFMRVISRNSGAPLADEADGMARKDTILLGVGDSVDVHVNFRDFTGNFMFHCHNLEHEDHFMMARFDVV